MLSAAQASPSMAAAAALAASGSVLAAVGAARRAARRGARSAKTVRGAASAAAEEDNPAKTAGNVLWAVLIALLDIFSAPPEEPTGKDAPGLRALGAAGVLGSLKGCTIEALRDGSAVDAASVAATGATTVLLFVTHFGDFNSWEVAQQLRSAVRANRLGGAKLAVVGIGTVAAGRKFAEMLELPQDVPLYADPRGACHAALGFSNGALPEYREQLNPYLRVFLMLLGVGSPGTIRTVLGGYVGNSSLSKERVAWVDEALKQGAAKGRFPTSVPQRLPWEAKKPGEDDMVELAVAGSAVWDGRGFGETGTRPFELATVRLQNMVSGIIANWNELKPPDDELLVRQGGAVVLDGQGQAVYFCRDKGILTYPPVEDVLAAARGI